MPFICLILLCALCLLLAKQDLIQTADSPAAQHVDGLTATLAAEQGDITVNAMRIGEVDWLFLPAFADAGSLEFMLDGERVSWEKTAEEEHAVIGSICRNGEKLMEVHVMQSAQLRSLFLFSDDPVHQGRAYIESSPTHDHETTGSVAIVDANGTVDYSGRLRQLRGRGNGTWGYPKKPYQIKLEEKVDLLKTGIPEEANRTWTLLAAATDATLMHNRVAFDMALEMGMAQTSLSEFVDLYYDGEYCGTYLLAEKVEINEGRIDETDYDDLMESWNAAIGQHDLETLPVQTDTNRFGNEYAYIEGAAAAQDPGLGAYLVEIETSGTLSDRCYFKLNDTPNDYYALKSPENPSREMAQYISERLQEAHQTLVSGGVHPQTGRTIEEEFNVDAFARLALISELSYNVDAFHYSSTFFVLPAGSSRFEPGPVWDAELAFFFLQDASDLNGMRLKDAEGWLADFYGTEVFARQLQKIYRDELYPMIHNILLGTERGRYLKPLDAYVQELDASSRMNEQRWKYERVYDARFIYGGSYEEEVELMKQFLKERSDWLYEVLVERGVWDTKDLDLQFEVQYGYPDRLTIKPFPWVPVEVEYESEQLTEADDMDYAWHRADVYLRALDGKPFKDPLLIVNGMEISYEIMEDGRLHFAVEYEDLSYRTAEYDGVDIGLIFNYDVYVEEHPYVEEQCEYDPELVMEYFCTEGMKQRHSGNGLFRPKAIADLYPDQFELYGNDWTQYYWALLEYGYEDGWLMKLRETFQPEVSDVL